MMLGMVLGLVNGTRKKKDNEIFKEE
jgi:hypothetical protein